MISILANVNSRSAKGNTALHDCAESGSLEILKLLLEKGATMQIDSYGLTPLVWIIIFMHIALIIRI